MPAILLTGAAGQGKTSEAIAQVKKLIRRKLIGKIWVLLPTDLQISAFRTRLLDEIGDTAHFGVEFFHFYDLYGRLLEIVGEPQRRAKDTARFRILRHILSEIDGDLQHFDTIAQTPGFVALAGEFVQELKQARIRPDYFTEIAQSDKDRDLARIYEEYQDFLRDSSLVDGEGEGWLALARLEESPELTFDVDLLLVDGYDQFNPVQAQLLAQLAQRLPNTFLTLTYQPSRADTAHRRFAQTRARLLESPIWQEQSMDSPLPAIRPAALAHLSARLFDTRQVSIANDESLSLVEAPDRRRESQAVLRRVKSLLLSGVQADQIAIVARNLEPYLPYFLDSARAYQIPLAMRHGAPLQENPAVAALLALADLAAQDFPRRATIDALRSPYLRCPDLTDAQVDTLDRISRARVVVQGYSAWFNAIHLSVKRDEAEGEEETLDAEEDLSPTVLSKEDAAALLTGLDSFFRRIRPPRTARARNYIAWFESLIGPDTAGDESAPREPESEPEAADHFQMISRIRAGSESDLVARDLAALDCLKHVFFDILSAYELTDAAKRVGWEDFHLDLWIAISNTSVTPSRATNRLGRVLLASVYEVRGLPHDHLFLLGLSEGEFPSHVAEDTLYTDAERRQMQQRGIPLLTRAESADESSLFYEMVSLARQTLTLTRSYTDKGNDLPASPFWRAVRAVVDAEVSRLPMATNVSLDGAANLSEMRVALADGLNGAASPELFAAHRWLLNNEDQTVAAGWSNALRARDIESRRLSVRSAHDAYTGRITDSTLRGIVAELLGPDYQWSASQINDYGICPYRFFARRMLHLEPIKEPQEGMDQLQLGSLLHKVLELTYKKIAEENLVINEASRARALELLDEVLTDYMKYAPLRHGFRETPMWPQEQESLRRRLQRLIEQDFSEDSVVRKILPGERYAYRQEVRFGFEDQPPVMIDGEAGPLLFRGAIDRVDIANGQIVVIDYKSGSTAIKSDDMVDGRNVQMMLYMYAAQQVVSEAQITGGGFWHMTSNKMETIKANDPQIDEARQNLHARVQQGRQGVFINSPSKMGIEKRCAHYCEFSQLCRVDRSSRNKPMAE